MTARTISVLVGVAAALVAGQEMTEGLRLHAAAAWVAYGTATLSLLLGGVAVYAINRSRR